MAKAIKKKARRLKKAVRKTLGTLFLISAIIVAAIPVENLRAYDSNGDPVLPHVVTDDGSRIPTVGPNDKIYATGDGRFQFAYVNAPDSVTEKVAVIVGYTQVGQLQGDTLQIPDKVDVYDKFTNNQGTYEGYVAINASGDFLYYNTPVIETDPETGAEISRTDNFQLCYYKTNSIWSGIDSAELYIKTNPNAGPSDTAGYTKTTNPNQWRLKDITVAYIGKQRVTQSISSGDAWTVEDVNDSAKNGVFAGNGSIVNLIVGPNLQGIGKYAFYNCTALQSISMGNGVTTIGNGAFENCVNVKNISLEKNSQLQKIGDHAFYNCNGLTAFNVPINVLEIGDYAFGKCFSLEYVDLDGYPEEHLGNVVLSKLGRGVFKDCTGLKGIAFHENFTQDIPASVFEGCGNLGYLSFPNANATVSFAPEGGTDAYGMDFTVQDFKDTVLDEFYFEGREGSQIHNVCRNNEFAFKYLLEDIFEIILTDGVGTATFWVNSSNQLIKCEINGMKDIPIPGTIGPYKITEINSSSFQNNKDLEKITIPSSILKIGEGAFKGCFNLKDVIFDEPINITYIGADAFQTQDVISGMEAQLSQAPELTFTGTISPDSVPFQYAMDPSSNINKGTQPVTYITYYSGWPTNLEVQYNPQTDKNELTGYPTMEALALSAYSEAAYPYITEEQAKAAVNAANKYIRDKNGADYVLDSSIQDEPITQDEQEILNAALNISIPQGVESAAGGLFAENEEKDLQWAKLHWKDLDWSNMTAELMPLKKSITTNGLAEIPARMFKGCVNLTSVNILGETVKIGDYAFEGCTYLNEASVSSSVSELGLRPFKDCPFLIDVDFQGSSNFVCEKSIIFGLAGGTRNEIIQCLESKGNGRANGSYNGKVTAEDLSGVTSMREEAFMDAANVTSVDFSDSVLTGVSKYGFAGTTNLYSVTLPATVKSIAEHAFQDSGIQAIYIPGSVGYIDNTAFGDADGQNISSNLTIYCPDDSNAAIFAEQKGIDHQPYSGEEAYLVSFWMHNYTTGMGEVIKQENVIAGKDATLPTVEEYPQLVQEGYKFTGWSEDGRDIAAPTDIWAQYTAIDPNAEKLTVEFYDINNNLIKSVLVDSGADATPEAPSALEMAVAGYSFTGWRPAISSITENTKTYAQYTALGEAEYVVNFYDWNQTLLYTQTVKAGGSAMEPKPPVREGYTFTGWLPGITNIQKNTDVYAQYEKNTGSNGSNGNNGNNGDNNGSNGNNNGTNNGNGVYYTLTVKNGSGSGSYVAGSQPIIIANDPASGQEFSHWSIEPSDVSIASTAVAATVITMPEKHVTVTANYKKEGTVTTTGSGNSSSSSSSGSGNKRPNNTGTVTNGGTTVVIDKNGLSNTGVVSATVNGSSDNFTIKITEDSAAAEAVVKALMAEYGDLSNIKYFPMDISLYDSTGTKKITDTKGLSISITLPLPDSLITYAGNNKVAGVVNDRLDKLTPKFTTISGVSCVTFTAEHFSPYVIYVDTDNLTAGVATDNTPETGDGIHPKWFLSIGLACLSFVFFMKRDRKKPQKVRVRA